ncbi:MAG: hypothetical protein LBD28_06570 [Tannerellaceae bacterium]|nr:hypothetical protein [Tannerellaceae bacterium]
MKPSLIVFLFLLFSPLVYSTDYLRSGDVRSLALGGNEVIFSAMFNPALTAIAPRSMQLSYFDRYSVKELGAASGCLYLRHPALSGGLHIASFGYDAWRETMFRLPIAKQLSERLSLGVSVQYAILQTELYEDQPAQLSVDAGMTWAPAEGWMLGLLLMNYPSVTFSATGDGRLQEFMPCRIQLGGQWAANDETLLAATIDCRSFRYIDVHAGIAYRAFERVELRGGIKLASLLPSFGVGYEWEPLAVDMAATYHPVLGFGYGLGMSYNF